MAAHQDEPDGSVAARVAVEEHPRHDVNSREASQERVVCVVESTLAQGEEEDSELEREAQAESQEAANIARLEQRLDQALALAARRDDLVDKLHGENQQLRHGELQAAILPLLRDLMRLHDDLEQIISVAPESADAVLIRDALSDILARHGIEKFAPAGGEPFDSARHTAVAAESIATDEGDRTIHAVRRPGFVRDDGSVIRTAEVIVYRHRPQEPPLATADTDGVVARSDLDDNHEDERS